MPFIIQRCIKPTLDAAYLIFQKTKYFYIQKVNTKPIRDTR